MQNKETEEYFEVAVRSKAGSHWRTYIQMSCQGVFFLLTTHLDTNKITAPAQLYTSALCYPADFVLMQQLSTASDIPVSLHLKAYRN